MKKDSEKNFELLKNTKKLSSLKFKYLKMIAQDGKVYMYDNYKLIPTDIQFKTSVKEDRKPFYIPVEDFVVTEKMY